MTAAALTALLCLACAGCSAAPVAGAQPMNSTAADLPSILRAARADAAERSGIDVARTSVLGSEAVTWRDGSLGCPQPGTTYTQALVSGWHIRIEAAGITHAYHASAAGEWFWCPPRR